MQRKTARHKERRRAQRQGPQIAAERYEIEPACRLAVAIIQQAVQDWDGLIRRKAWRLEGQMATNNNSMAGAGSGFEEIRMFFQNGFMELPLPDGSPLSPEAVLDQLEKRLTEAMEADVEWQNEIQAAAETAHTSA